MSYQPTGPCLNDLLGLPNPLPEGAHFKTLRGFLALVGNENLQCTQDPDPAAYSLIGFTGGKWSWKDDDGIERVMLTFRFAANGKDGEVALFLWNEARYQWALRQGTAAWTAKANDYAMQQVLLINPDAFECDILLKALAGGVAGSGDPASVGEGDYELRVQGDGNVVVYQKNGSADPSKWTPVYNRFDWDAWRDRVTATLAALGHPV